MDKTYAYVDESGNSDLDTSKVGSSGFFVVCSILVAEKDLQDAYQRAEELRRQHFQTGEIKSSKVRAKDAERRIRILTDLAELPMKLYFVVVDKERIYKDGGLQFKTSFVKHINGLLYGRLFRNCRNLQMTVDEHGGVEFQESLKAYVEDRYVGDLFGDDHAFQTKSSKDDVLIQVADFFAGSVAQIYEQKAVGDIAEVYKKILREQTLGAREHQLHLQKLSEEIQLKARSKASKFDEPSDAIRGKEGAIKRLVESYGFVSPQLFGSTVRGDDHEGSDLDILATIPSGRAGPISLFDIASLEDELQALIGVPVDFNIANNMPAHFRHGIEGELVEL